MSDPLKKSLEFVESSREKEKEKERCETLLENSPVEANRSDLRPGEWMLGYGF